MKNQYLLFIPVLFVITACSKDNEIQKQVSNENHRIWKLAQVTGHWDYSLSNGFQSEGSSMHKYVYGCSRPVGRAISVTSFSEENGATLWDHTRTISYNNNFMVDTENATESGDAVVRTFQYDSDNKWTGTVTGVNGEVLDDEIEIGPGGQVKSYTHDGVRTVYEWKADNVTKVKIYVQVTAPSSTAINSLVFNQLGIDEKSKNRAKKQILNSLHQLQNQNRPSQLRSNNPDEWVLVFVEEQTVDKGVIQPFFSAKNGYPGTTVDGGYLALPKNFITKFKGYPVDEEGTPGAVVYQINFYYYTTKDNLPVYVNFSSFYSAYKEDEDGSLLDYSDFGTYHYEYISGCNQKSN